MDQLAQDFGHQVPLERWALCVRPGGWLAIVEIDDLFTGHHPLPAETENAFREFMDHACSNDRYDFCMGRRLSEICRAARLNVVSEHAWKDRELAFDGAALPEILTAWRQRFARMPGMEKYFGDDRFNQITNSFLKTISSPEHYTTAAVVLVLAQRPI